MASLIDVISPAAPIAFIAVLFAVVKMIIDERKGDIKEKLSKVKEYIAKERAKLSNSFLEIGKSLADPNQTDESHEAGLAKKAERALEDLNEIVDVENASRTIVKYLREMRNSTALILVTVSVFIVVITEIPSNLQSEVDALIYSAFLIIGYVIALRGFRHYRDYRDIVDTLTDLGFLI